MDRHVPDQAENQLLVDRIRLAGKIAFAGILVQMVAAWLLGAAQAAAILGVQGLNAVVVGVIVALVREPSERTRNLVLMLVGYAVTAICAGAVGVLAGDSMTSVIVIFACALGPAAVVPWGPWWQGAGALVSLAAAMWTVAFVDGFRPAFLFQNTGSFLPVLAGTVLVSAVVTRQLAQVAEAERQRNARESSLREAKQRLEREIDEHRQTEDALRFALRELDHRVKNTLATVQSVVQRTLESAQSPDEFADAVFGRIHAMSRVHSALAERKWDGLGVKELIELVVGPYRLHDDSVSIMCDEGFISSDVARMLSMTLHELATNAAKYGALSTTDGRLRISSRIETAARPHLHIDWHEANGPEVARPTHRGFGTKLIEEGMAYELDGVATLEFGASGVHCEIDIPLPRPPVA